MFMCICVMNQWWIYLETRFVYVCVCVCISTGCIDMKSGGIFTLYHFLFLLYRVIATEKMVTSIIKLCRGQMVFV